MGINSSSDNLLQVIDYDLNLNITHNPNLAHDLLKMLVNELPEIKIHIVKAFSSHDIASVEELVHKLHGAVCYCGVPRLKSAASQLEIALKSKDSEPEHVKLLLQALVFEMDEVLACYEKRLS